MSEPIPAAVAAPATASSADAPADDAPAPSPTVTGRDRAVLAIQSLVAHLVELATGLESFDDFDAHHQLGRIVRMEMVGTEVAGHAKKLRVQFGAVCIDRERAAFTPSDATEEPKP